MPERDTSKEIAAGSVFPMLMQKQLQRIDETGLERDRDFDDEQFMTIAQALADFVSEFKENSQKFLHATSEDFERRIKKLDHARPAVVGVSISMSGERGKDQSSVAQGLSSLLRTCSNDIHVLLNSISWLRPAIGTTMKGDIQTQAGEIKKNIPKDRQFDDQAIMMFGVTMQETIEEFCSRSNVLLNNDEERSIFVEKLSAISVPKRVQVVRNDNEWVSIGESQSKLNDALERAKDCLNLMFDCLEITKDAPEA